MEQHPNHTAAHVDQIFKTLGYTKTGGIWGNAQWKKIDENTVICIGGATGYSPSEEDDYTSAPVDMRYPAMVYVYKGPFYDGWTVDYGECPVDDITDETMQAHEFKNLFAAMDFALTVEPSADSAGRSQRAV